MNASTAPSASPQSPLDRFGRSLHDLRISVTDRCNFRCTYCMPKEVFNSDYVFLERSRLLTFEEIERLARIFAGLGVAKLRLTGGEPLLRRNLDNLVGRLAGIPGIEDVCLTTNGSLLTGEAAARLAEAGLNRITISLDGLDNEVFQSLSDVQRPVDEVLAAIDHAAAAGLGPVKINMVVKRGANEDQILPMAEHFRGTGHILRFIEYMDVGNANDWKLDQVMPAEEVLRMIGGQWPVEPADPNYPGEVARRWRYRDGQGEFGVIASVTQPFCGGCHRVRLSADGMLYTCLFASDGHDLKSLLRSGADDAALRRDLIRLWKNRGDRYSELRTEETSRIKKVEMSYIGG